MTALAAVRNRLPSGGKGGLTVVVGMAIVVVALVGATARVDAGDACAVTRFGKVVSEAGPGLHLKIPIADRYHCFRTASTFYEVLESDFDSRADFKDGILDGVTKDGQPVGLTFNLRYRIPPDRVGEIYAQVAKTMDQVNERVVKFHARLIARQLVQQYTAADLYSGDLSAVSQTIAAVLTPRFEESWVTLEYFEIKRPRFQPEYEEAIEAKQIAREQIETKANQAEAAEQDAIRAANLAAGDANAERIRAQGEAEAIALRGQAVRENPEVITLNYIEALKTISWAIFDGETLTPFLTIPTPTGGTNAAVTSTPEPTAES